MGPVSFESIDGGSSRDEAMSRAATLRQVGVAITAVNEEQTEQGPRFTIVIRSGDLDRALRALGLGS